MILLQRVFDPKGSVWSQPRCLVRTEKIVKQLHPWTLGRMGKSPGSPKWTEAKQWAFSEQIFWEKPKWWCCGRESGAVPSHRHADENRDLHRWIIVGLLPESLRWRQHSKYQFFKMLTAALETASEIEEEKVSVETRDSCPCLWWEMPCSLEEWVVLNLGWGCTCEKSFLLLLCEWEILAPPWFMPFGNKEEDAQGDSSPCLCSKWRKGKVASPLFYRKSGLQSSETQGALQHFIMKRYTRVKHIGGAERGGVRREKKR